MEHKSQRTKFDSYSRDYLFRMKTSSSQCEFIVIRVCSSGPDISNRRLSVRTHEAFSVCLSNALEPALRNCVPRLCLIAQSILAQNPPRRCS